MSNSSIHQTDDLLTIAEASAWVSEYLEKSITPSNISYLIQYGQVRKMLSNGSTMVSRTDLLSYYEARRSQEAEWKKQLGEDLNWELSFDKVREKDRTKHVHRLHSYKGKFIPQLVEYFLDDHVDVYKHEVFFHPGDIVIDPFCGSGTTLVQANELGIHAIGLDISQFNALISNIKIARPNMARLSEELHEISYALSEHASLNGWSAFDEELTTALSAFNQKHFPSSEYKYKVRNKTIDQKTYAAAREAEFSEIYERLIEKYKLPILSPGLTYLDTWYLYPIRREIDFVANLVSEIDDLQLRSIAQIVLSRTVRSCRATTHADLATLKEPVTSPYYCRKHYKICRPLFSIESWWKEYSEDTIERLKEFDHVRTATHQLCLVGDSRKCDILSALKLEDQGFAELLSTQKARGIFCSPPYVGLIDYHEQHAYAYELFGFERRDSDEIGALALGSGQKSKGLYIQGIAEVLINCRGYLIDDFDVFIVANDKFNLYPKIADIAHMQIVNEFKRPVLNRTEKDQSAYAESIFHLKAR